jgi:hypothetical protein
MKYTKLPIALFLLSLLVFTKCGKDSDPKKAECLPTLFSIEEEEGKVKAEYTTKNQLVRLTYTFPDNPVVFQSIRSYDSKGKILGISFVFNGNTAEDFVKVTQTETEIKEEFFRTSSSAENLRSYRYYYLDENKRVVSFSERERENSTFIRIDSVAFTYTTDNVSQIRTYNALDELTATYNLVFDNNINPYNKANFSGDEYLYSFLNLSKNNPVSYTHVEAEETTTFSYTYGSTGFPLTRQSSAVATVGEFSYSCDNP